MAACAPVDEPLVDASAIGPVEPDAGTIGADAGGGGPDGGAAGSDAGPAASDAGATVDAGNSDAGSADARAESCTVDDDCQEPPPSCHLAGTCNLETNECELPALDCSQLDSECSVGTCEAGTCVSVAIDEDESCGNGTECDGFGTCDYGDNLCATSGTMVQTCRDFTCQAGQCTAGEDYEESETCTRDTHGVTCGAPVEECGDCEGFSSTCDKHGHHVVHGDDLPMRARGVRDHRVDLAAGLQPQHQRRFPRHQRGA